MERNLPPRGFLAGKGVRSYGASTLSAVAYNSGGTSESGSDPQLAPLNRVRAGCVVIIKRLTAAPEVNQRLREMGFGEEQRVKVITLQNNVLCQVCNARLGLSAKLAESILVQPLGSMRLAA
jgi:Fe2+ transport system protein FeoA